MAISKEDLLKKRLHETTHTVEGLGEFRIRALSRKEVLALGIKPGAENEMDLAEMEQKIISASLVEPRLTREDVATWQANSDAGEMNSLFMAILDLSGMGANGGKEVTKEAMRRFQ